MLVRPHNIEIDYNHVHVCQGLYWHSVMTVSPVIGFKNIYRNSVKSLLKFIYGWLWVLATDGLICLTADSSNAGQSSVGLINLSVTQFHIQSWLSLKIFFTDFQ